MQDIKEFFYTIDYPVWFAIYTRPNHEKKVYKLLKSYEIEIFLPTRIVKAKDFREIEVPLFRSYVFIKTVPRTEPFYMAMDLNGSMGYVKFNGVPSIIEEEEIISLKKLVNNGNGKIFPVYDIKKGKKVTFKGGPFAGCEVVIKEIDERKNLVIAWIKEILAGGALEVKKDEFLKWI